MRLLPLRLLLALALAVGLGSCGDPDPEPRRVFTASRPPSTTLKRAAVCGCSSATALPDIAFSAATRRVIVPDWYWARTRPVVRKSG